jgi:GntR family transcriptional regulator / MocR family aminotransferase
MGKTVGWLPRLTFSDIFGQNSSPRSPPKGPLLAFSKEPIFELDITLPPRGSGDRSRALYGQLRAAIIDGRLQPGLCLPPTRALASALGVSRNMVLAAYESLLSEGSVWARQGAGTYVARVVSRAPVHSVQASDSLRAWPTNTFWRTTAASLGDLSHSPRRTPARFNFQLGLPDKGHFPFEIWRRLSARALRAFAKGPAVTINPQGQQALREAISKHVSFARAVACTADDVVVTTGAQQAFDLLARTPVTAGRTTVAVEEPSYPLMRTAFSAAGARIVPIDVDEEGLIVERLPKSTRVICVTPSHQFPLGTVMSLRRRVALLAFARSRGAVIIEDDYDGEFRYGGHPVDALQTLDRTDRVFYVGTFSKCLFPTIRLGFIVAPPWARPILVAAKLFTDLHSCVLSQDTLAIFIAEGHLARHVRKMRRIYDERRRVLLSGLQDRFADLLTPILFPAGLHLAAWAKSAAFEHRIVATASRHGIWLHPLRPFFSGQSARPGVVFGYGAIEKSAILEGLSILQAALA